MEFFEKIKKIDKMKNGYIVTGGLFAEIVYFDYSLTPHIYVLKLDNKKTRKYRKNVQEEIQELENTRKPFVEFREQNYLFYAKAMNLQNKIKVLKKNKRIVQNCKNKIEELKYIKFGSLEWNFLYYKKINKHEFFSEALIIQEETDIVCKDYTKKIKELEKEIAETQKELEKEVSTIKSRQRPLQTKQ